MNNPAAPRPEGVLHGLEVYLVGGAVRDRLLGLASGDRDWVVVGSTPEAMRARGFIAVGRDFPVFLHPASHEEYALARTERKSGRGYRGFSVHAAPDVTLAQDLARRDLRINALAAPPDWAGEVERVIDPLGGLQDLRARRLHHAGSAFAEDPLRVLRVARFAARFGDFAVAPATLQLMRAMVQAGEMADLVPERVWQEISRGLMQPHPARLLQTLAACGALAALLPELHAVPPTGAIDAAAAPTQQALARAARQQADLPVRYACLLHTLAAQKAEAVGARWRVPALCREVAEMVLREQAHIAQAATLEADALLRLFERCDALRRPARFAQALRACACVDSAGDDMTPGHARLHTALAAARGIDGAAMARQAAHAGLRGAAVGAALRAARLAALGRVINCLPCALPSCGDGCAKRGAANSRAIGKPCDKADTPQEGSAFETGN